MNKNFSNLLKYLSVLPLKFFYRFLDHEKVIANSTMTSDNIKKFTGKIPRYVLPPPLDFKRFKKGKSKDYFLTVSRLVPYKRIGWQIKAFKDTKKRLVIVGYGELFERYKRITRGMKNVEVRSPPSDSELIKLYAGCEAFIFTSYREHFGMTPLEAMASGKPVISTKDGGGPLDYIKEGKNGFFANNVSELRSMVLSLEKKDLEKMEKECIETARNYSFDVFVQKFSKILEEQFP